MPPRPKRDPSATMVRRNAAGGDNRATHMFDCPVAKCTWSGSLAKTPVNVVLDPAVNADQSALDDLLVTVTSVVTHLRDDHGARLPGERGTAPPAPAGGTPTHQ